MGDVFLKLLNMSIAASWLILAVLLLRLLFKKIPKWVNCLLWGIVAIRLICPFPIEFEYSLIPSAETIKSSAVVEGEVQSYIPAIDSKSAVVENTINPILSEAFAYNEYESIAPLQVFNYVAGVIWCSGMVLLAVYVIVSGLRTRYMVKEAVRYKKNIYICDAVKVPFILGVIRPRIYLSSGVNREELNYIIAHEQAHLKRKDHWWKLFGYLLLSVYWFWPLCWVAYFLLCKDIELACDEKVIRDMTLSEKKEYSKTLLSCSQQGRMVMAYPLAFGEVGVKERVKAVLSYKKTAFGILAAAIVVCIIAAVCFLTNPPKEYRIRVTIPAGCKEAFSYSDEEICSMSGTITLYAGEDLGDTEIVLLPVEVKEENAYDEPTYITPGMPVKMEVEKGAWFKIGVSVQNFSEESRDVYVSVENVEVRIASGENFTEPEEEEKSEIQPEQENVAQNPDSKIYEEAILNRQVEVDKVCISVQPSVLRDYISYYYIPEGKDQEWLQKFMNTLPTEVKPYARRWEGMKETGWQIVYQDKRFMVFEGGYLYYSYSDEKGPMEYYVEAPKLCDYIQIMLQGELDYYHFDPADIESIVSAKLDVCSIFTNNEFYSQTIVDEETLKLFEEWFSNAEYIYGGAECGNQAACLELTLGSGEVVRLSVATDSCSNFSINGVYYDYCPISDWDNREFFGCFDKIPWDWLGDNTVVGK